MKTLTGFARIQQAKKENELYLLNRFRNNPTANTMLFSIQLYNALDRLLDAGMIVHKRATRSHLSMYVVRKYARPVTR